MAPSGSSMLTALQLQYSRSIGHTIYNTIAYGDDRQASVLRVQYSKTGQGNALGRYFSGAGFL